MKRPKLGVSACLLGHAVRYDGGHKRVPFLAETAPRFFELIPVCPEVDLGLGVPREPIQLEREAKLVRLRAPGSGRDLTEAMDAYARAKARELGRKGISGYVFKAGSPSCGLDGVPVHAGRRSSKDGRGLFARVLLEVFPALPAIEEGALTDPRALEDFMARVFAFCKR